MIINKELRYAILIASWLTVMCLVANLTYDISESVNNIMSVINILIFAFLVVQLLWNKRKGGKSNIITTIFDNFGVLAMFALMAVAIGSTTALCVTGGVALLKVIILLLPKEVMKS
ncbi:MAG: hypothetical protein SNH18_05000 [Rikenellaceae bacterium]